MPCLARPLLKKNGNIPIILKKLISTLFRFPGSRYHSGVVVSELWRFNQNREGAVVLIRAKVTLTKKLGIKSRYIRNSNGLPILALEL